MQPKTNTLNLILFAILSFVILMGSTLLQGWLYPRPKPVPAEARLAADLMARGSELAIPGVPGLGKLTQDATDKAVASYLASMNYRLPRVVAKAPQPQKPPAPAPVQAEVKPLPPAKHKTFWLGNDTTSNLHVKLTSFGAGVENLTLTHFDAASSMGLPEPGKKMELLREQENRAAPSFRLYHYAKPDDENPADTLGHRDWNVDASQTDMGEGKPEQRVTFFTDLPNVRIEKIYTLRPGDYHLGLEVRIRALSKQPLKFRYQLAGGHGMPIEGEWYTNVYRNALTGWINERGAFQRDFQDSRSIGFKEGGEEVLRGSNQRIIYAGTAIQYFASVIAVDDRQPKQDFLSAARPTVEKVTDPHKPYLDDITMRVMSQQLELQPGEEVVQKYLLYNGPVKVRLLADGGAGQQPLAPELLYRYINDLHLNTLADYQMPHWFGENFLWNLWSELLILVTNLMHSLLFWLQSWIPNYGVCIILLTVLVRGLMHPVSRRQARTSMKMQALAPELKRLQERFKDDPQAKQKAMMDLYRRHGVHPMGSCWIVLLQMPIFLGLYYALQESIHFRLASFLWIKNLAAPDMLINWGQNIPWISRPEDQGSFLYLGPFFNLLPVLAVTLMIVQQKFLMPPPTDEQQEMQQKMMKYMMIFMGIMFYKVAAGLCIYFIASSLWGLAERKMLPKPTKPATGATGASPPSDGAAAGSTKRSKAASHRQRAARSATQNGGFLGKVKEMWEELLEQAKKK